MSDFLLPCVESDYNTEIFIPELLGDDYITSFVGNVSPYKFGNKFLITERGYIHSIEVSNGSIYPCQERNGNILFDAVNGNHAICKNIKRTYKRGNIDHLYELIIGSNTYYLLDDKEYQLRISIPNNNFDFMIRIKMTTISSTSDLRIEVGSDYQEFGNINTRSRTKTVDIFRESGIMRVSVNGIYLGGEIGNNNDYSGQTLTISGGDLPVVVYEILFRRYDTDTDYFIIASSDEIRPKDQSDTNTIIYGKAKTISVPMRFDNRNLNQDVLGNDGTYMNPTDVKRVYDNRIINAHSGTFYNSPIEPDNENKIIVMARNFLDGFYNDAPSVKILNKL